MGLRIEAKQLFHRFLFLIFHFSASLRNTCSYVPLQTKEILKKRQKKMKENKLKVSFFVQAKRTDKKGFVPVIG